MNLMGSPFRVLVAFLWVAASAWAQTSSSAPANPPAAQGTISGIVTDAATGQPLKKATIVFRNTQASGGMRLQQALAVTTGVDGRYTMRLDAGEYRLAATRNNYVRQSYGEKDPRRPGTIVTLAAGQELKDIDFHLVAGGVISGRVIDEDGEPMSGVSVQVLRAAFQDGERKLQPAGGMARTDDRGEFRIFGLEPRHYYVSATRRGMMDFFNGPGEFREGGPAMLQQSEGYAVSYYPGTTEMSAASSIEVRAGDEQRVNFTLVPSRTFRITGKVMDASGQPLKSGFGVLLSRNGSPTPSGFTQVEDGKLDIHGITPGSYSLMVGIRDEEDRQAAQREIEVADQDVGDVNLTLTRGTEMHGVVKFVDFAGKQPNVNVMLMPKRSGNLLGITSGEVKADGSFTLKDVFPQDYVTTLTGVPQTAYVKSIRVGGDETVTSGFNGGKGTTMQIVISGKASVLEGTVTDKDGKPFAGATVVLISDQPVRTRRGSGPQTTSSDQNGHFTFRGLRPANYRVAAWEAIEEEDYSDPDFPERQGGRFTALNLGEGEDRTTDLRLVTADDAVASR